MGSGDMKSGRTPRNAWRRLVSGEVSAESGNRPLICANLVVRVLHTAVGSDGSGGSFGSESKPRDVFI